MSRTWRQPGPATGEVEEAEELREQVGNGCLPALGGPLGVACFPREPLEEQSVSGELSGGSVQKRKNQHGGIMKQRHFKKSG
ncbi:unnamed protein product [Rangifer tarandus platyrhynchus]|uniref:Uncharacterized protein n=2 Tax=Rangifer tarandus platyrhynchus TaxID=3082113 RepID=A0ABN9A0F4_RANTA|nr:unnamed protein product [Rangifer tarandus platyrhynchus]CAI9714154.1 unnamed protein product [Rangifer tarandus platyrhynchus]